MNADKKFLRHEVKFRTVVASLFPVKEMFLYNFIICANYSFFPCRFFQMLPEPEARLVFCVQNKIW